MARLQILCINKSDRPNPHERILTIGGLNANGTPWRMSQQDAVKFIADGTHSFYVQVQGRAVDVVVAVSPYQNQYIKTAADGAEPNNFLSLPECSS